MVYGNLHFEVRDRIATVTFDRPRTLNALSDDVMTDLGGAVDEIATREEIGGAILTGAGDKAFVAGADIGELATQGPIDGKARALRGQAVLRRLETCGKPVVAAVNGYALGGGCEVALACHLRVASDRASFGQPEVKLGIGPGYGGTQRLARLVGKGRAIDMILTGRTVSADEALQIGLVNRVVPHTELAGAARDLLDGILAMGPIAVRLALEAIDRGFDLTLEDGLLLEANHFGLASATSDMREGMQAFLEKRKPRFTGQ